MIFLCKVSFPQNLVGSLERSRAAMAEDLANISAEYETLKKEVKTIPHLQQKLHVSATDIIVVQNLYNIML